MSKNVCLYNFLNLRKITYLSLFYFLIYTLLNPTTFFWDNITFRISFLFVRKLIFFSYESNLLIRNSKETWSPFKFHNKLLTYFQYNFHFTSFPISLTVFTLTVDYVLNICILSLLSFMMHRRTYNNYKHNLSRVVNNNMTYIIYTLR